MEKHLMRFALFLVPCMACAAAEVDKTPLGRVVTNVYISPGPSREQLREFVRQLQIKALIDVGRGWKEDLWDPRPWSPHQWPAFQLRTGTVRTALNRFFAVRSLYRWRATDAGTVVIEPSKETLRIGPLLRDLFKKLVVAERNADNDFVVGSLEVLAAWEESHPEWARNPIESHITFDFGRGTDARENLAGLVAHVSSPVPFIAHTFEDFLDRWLQSDARAFVCIEYDDWYGIYLSSWNPERFQATAAQLFATLLPGASLPPGYAHISGGYPDCMREIARRYHFNRDAILKAFEASSLFEKSDGFHWREVSDFLTDLDQEAFYLAMLRLFPKAPPEVRIKRIKGWNFPRPLDSNGRYRPFYEALRKSPNPRLRQEAESAFRTARKYRQEMKDPQLLTQMGKYVRSGKDRVDPDGGAFKELQKIGTPAAARAVASFVYNNDAWDDYGDGPELITYVVRRIPSGTGAAVEKLIADLEKSNPVVSRRIRLTLRVLMGLKDKKAIDRMTPAELRAFWRKRKAQQERRSKPE